MRTNPHFREFLELDTQIPESVVNCPVKVAELPDLNLGGRDFVFLKDEGLLFIAQSDMNITSRLDSYLINVSFITNHSYSSHCPGRSLMLRRTTTLQWEPW
jgi:hypothetical protein